MAEPTAADARINDLYARAMRAHQAGRLDEAEALYGEILTADPRQLDSLHLLGVIAHQRGRPKDAVEMIGRAIAANDRIPPHHVSIGAAYGALGQRDKAIEHYRKAVELDPNSFAAHHSLSQALGANGDLAESERHFERAVALKPELAADLVDAAASHLTAGRPNEALEAVSRSLAVRDDPQARLLFVQCVRSADRLPPVLAFRGLMIRALREAWARPVYLTGPAIAIITNEPSVMKAIRAATAAWPRRLGPQETGQAVGVLALDELLRAVLDNAVVNHPGLERLLATVRAILLDAAVHARSEIAKEMMGFACSLARQCFINEYVFDVSDHERQALAWLRSQARAALADRSNVLAIHLIAIASYAPLASLERDQALLERRWLKPLAALILEQVREPQIEAGLRATMPRLTAITDPVSRDVRQQYEDNPYPRWVSVAPTPPQESVLAHLRAMFPHGPLQDLREPDTLDILVAGCGTGQQPIGTAQRFPRARVLAIDLSLASLAYAKRKSDAAGVAIEYGQADILELNLDRRFDIVESSGVLHHLADPIRGWAALDRLVKPGGFMRIGLYSELGRQNVVALRQMIAERGYKATPDDIRRARQEMMSGDASRFASILHSPDFFSISACRDLLFHVQEHRLTLPRIGAFLTEHGLRLLGFELDAPTAARYRAAFPQDATMTDLALWDRFETANPDTFRGMYNFWAWKPA